MQYHDIIDFINVICTIVMTVFTILIFLEAIRRLPQRNRAFFGGAIEIEKNKINNQLTDENLVYCEKFEGGGNKIFPQLVIEKIDKRKMEVDSKHKEKKRMITYFVIDNNVKMEKIWYIK